MEGHCFDRPKPTVGCSANGRRRIYKAAKESMCYYGHRFIEFLQNFVKGKFLGKVNMLDRKRFRTIIMRLVCGDVKQMEWLKVLFVKGFSIRTVEPN